MAAALIAWIATAVVLWTNASPLGDNEARYARVAQQLLDGDEPRYHYVSRGMAAIAAPGVLAGGSEHALRLLPAVLGVGFVLAAALLAYRTIGGAAAAWFVGILTATKPMARCSADLMSDLPAAGCLLGGIAVLLGELEREEGPRWRVMWTAPLFAAAFYVRYGSCIPIAIAGAVGLLLYWRAVLRKPVVVLATVAVFFALLVPHAVEANAITGSPLGFLRDSKHVLRVDHAAAGLVGYVSVNPFKYYGLTAPVLLLGVLSILRPRSRRAVMLWLVAAGQVVALGMTTVAESRYIFLAMALFLMLGTDTAYRAIVTRPPRLRIAIGLATGAAIVACWVLILISSRRLDERLRVRWHGLLTASAAVARDAAGRHCQVVARHTNQVEWYSGCDAVIDVPPLGKEPVYLVRDGIGGEQPDVPAGSGRRRTLLAERDVLVLRLNPHAAL